VSGLQQTKLFAGLLSAELRMLEQTSHLLRFRTGEVIFKEGDPGDGIYIVDEGQVEISVLLANNQRRELARIGPGDFFGEMAVLEAVPRSATAVARTPTVVRFIPSAELFKVLERAPKVAVSLLREVSQRLRQFDDQFLRELIQAERLGLVGRFTRSILHDIKGPLTVISMASEVGCAPDTPADMRKTSLERIRRQVDRLTQMINELMEFTRGERSPMVLARLDFQTFLTQILEEIRHELRARGVEVVREGQPPAVALPFDPHRLTNVLWNLVNNALDAMPGGGKLFFRTRTTERELVVEIEDTGSGIASEIASRLFEPFATFGKTRGTGLGLSICRKIIEDHGGTIRALSQPGRGAIFQFTLPLQPAQASGQSAQR
jgi:signal transduction histidine kinase